MHTWEIWLSPTNGYCCSKQQAFHFMHIKNENIHNYIYCKHWNVYTLPTFPTPTVLYYKCCLFSSPASCSNLVVNATWETQYFEPFSPEDEVYAPDQDCQFIFVPAAGYENTSTAVSRRVCRLQCSKFNIKKGRTFFKT